MIQRDAFISDSSLDNVLRMILQWRIKVCINNLKILHHHDDIVQNTHGISCFSTGCGNLEMIQRDSSLDNVNWMILQCTI